MDCGHNRNYINALEKSAGDDNSKIAKGSTITKCVYYYPNNGMYH